MFAAGRRRTVTTLVLPRFDQRGFIPRDADAACMGGSNRSVAAHVVAMTMGVNQPVKGPVAQNCRTGDSVFAIFRP